MVRLCIGLVLALALLGVPSSALADVEPNDDIAQFEGPLLEDQSSTGGTLSPRGDVDWYAFYAQPGTFIVVVGYEAFNTPDCGARMTLLNSDGEILNSMKVEGDDNGEMDYTAPVRWYETRWWDSRYFVRVSTRDACTPSYHFSAYSRQDLLEGPPRPDPQPVAEPNQLADEATPLAGGVDYEGTFETDTDWELFALHTAPGKNEIDVSITNPSPCDDVFASEIRLEPKYEFFAAHGVRENTVAHFYITSYEPQTRYVNLRSDCPGSRYLIRADPSYALTDTAPEVTVLKPLPIVLGSRRYKAPDGWGWGDRKPPIVGDGSLNGRVVDIRWRKWGRRVAYGQGKTVPYLEGVSPRLVQLRASRIGSCARTELPSYTRLELRRERRHSGRYGKWATWAHDKHICGYD